MTTQNKNYNVPECPMHVDYVLTHLHELAELPPNYASLDPLELGWIITRPVRNAAAHMLGVRAGPGKLQHKCQYCDQFPPSVPLDLENEKLETTKSDFPVALVPECEVPASLNCIANGNQIGSPEATGCFNWKHNPTEACKNKQEEKSAAASVQKQDCSNGIDSTLNSSSTSPHSLMEFLNIPLLEDFTSIGDHIAKKYGTRVPGCGVLRKVSTNLPKAAGRKACKKRVLQNKRRSSSKCTIFRNK